MIKYCNLCKREAEFKRKIGFGTILLCIITSGLYIPFILLYSKRCHICGSASYSNIAPKKVTKK